MGRKCENIRRWWENLRKSTGFHNAYVFLIFLFIAALFWLVMALNDNVTRTIDVRLNVTYVPDSVTFINDPPASFHVTVRDKGTTLMRAGGMNRAAVSFNFRDYAEGGRFRVSSADISGALKATFGNSAVISACSLDSLNLAYTSDKGKRVPVVVSFDVSASPGFIISYTPVPEPASVLVYADRETLDTISRVYTRRLVHRNLEEPYEAKIGFRPISGVKIVPSEISVRIPVEPLVKKESMVTVKAVGVPDDKGLLFFPTKIPVVYYVPMGLFNSEEVPFEVIVKYSDIFSSGGDRVAVKLGPVPDYIENVQLKADSVEYSLIKK